MNPLHGLALSAAAAKDAIARREREKAEAMRNAAAPADPDLARDIGAAIDRDDVEHPAHYASGPIECYDAMTSMLTREELIGYLRGNSFKYRWRFRAKGGAQDLRKAAWYENKLLDMLENG